MSGMTRGQEALLDQLIGVAGGDSGVVERALRDTQGRTPPTMEQIVRRILEIRRDTALAQEAR